MERNKGEKILLIIISSCLILTFGNILWAEDTATQTITMRISPICLLNVNKNPEPLIIVPVSYAGDIPADALESSSYLQYSSAVARGQTRSITAYWESSDSAPSGCTLMLQAFPSSGRNEGISTGEIALSSFPQVIIKDIGSCATGTGPQNGARLNYRLTVTDIENMVVGESKRATITFTLMDVF